MIELFSKFQLEELLLLFFKQKDTIAFTIIPSSMENLLATHRTALAETEATRAFLTHYQLPPNTIDSCMQFKLNCDAYCAQMFPGRSMRNSQSVSKLKFLEQITIDSKIITRFEYSKEIIAEFIIETFPKKNYIKSFTRLINNSNQSIYVEYLAGCSIGMLSPFQKDDGPGKYFLHRFQSSWSAEGRPLEESIEEANLEMSWQAAGLRNIRFGVNGSMPVRGFFPFMALEDREHKVFWGITANAAASWELEIERTGDFFNLSGSYPGRDANNWVKELKKGETISSMEMVISCTKGTLDQLCNEMKEAQNNTIFPKENQGVFFNEFCTTWGKPWQENISQLIKPAKNSGADYFIIDAGWFQSNNKENPGCVGDWIVKEEMYPNGSFNKVIDDINKEGLIPGIWFEFEIATSNSKIANEHLDWFLTLDNVPIKQGARMFLDLRKEVVQEHLANVVFNFIEKYNIGYIKVDYNGSTPGLCDGPSSPSENHRIYMDSVFKFFTKLKETFPKLMLEICASGGHRLTSKWSEVADIFSFSDAHEGVEIPLIAANVQRLIPASKSQIWATVRPWSNEKRLYYLLCGGLLGRICLSGDIDKLDKEQMDIVKLGISFHKDVLDIICNGKSTVEQYWNKSFNHPTGWQKVTFCYQQKKLTVIHIFEDGPKEIALQLTGKNHRIFAANNTNYSVKNNVFTWMNAESFSALAIVEE
jgi:alpha-galactosidase